MQQALFSICCLGYNHAAFLKENFDSIARINYPNIEVIAVDDGSADGSAALIEEIKGNYPFPIRLIAQQNTGNVGKNFNTALKLAKGELVTFIALDDVFRPDTIADELAQMNQHPDLAFVASSHAIAMNNDGFILNSLPELPTAKIRQPSIEQLLEFEYSDFGSFYIQGTVFRKAMIDAIGGFDEDMTGDDIVLRTKLFRYLLDKPEWKFHLIQQNNVFYRLHDNNVHKNTARQIKIVTEYLNRYWPDRPPSHMMLQWAKSFISTQPLAIYLPALLINSYAQELLRHPEIQESIKQSAALEYEQNLSQRNKLFDKQKHSNGKRTVTLFGCISFSYTGKSHKQAGKHSKAGKLPEAGKHYLDN